MRNFWLARVACFATVLTFSTIVFGLSTYFITQTSITVFPEGVPIPVFDSFVWAKLALASSALTLLCLAPMLALDMFLDAHTSKIMVELIVLAILAVLWLTSSADASSFLSGDPPVCDALDVFEDDTVDTLCHSYQPIVAFSWVNCVILVVYAITLLIYAIKADAREKSVWMTSVRKADFSAKSPSNNAYAMAKQDNLDISQNPVQVLYNQNPLSSLPGTPKYDDTLKAQYNRFPEVYAA